LMDSGEVSVVRVTQSARVCSGADARNGVVDAINSDVTKHASSAALGEP